MIEIIPTINEKTFEEVKAKVALVEESMEQTGVKWIQLDISDGTFSETTGWHDPKDLADLDTKLKIEVHLMINEPENIINDWLHSGIVRGNGDHGLCRVIFHLSASKNPELIIDSCRDHAKEVGIAIGPDESLVKAIEREGEVDMFQILGVNPGPAGQEILPETFERIKELRKACPNHPIEIDGGVNLKNAKQLVSAGATILVSTSAVFKDDKIVENVEALRREINAQHDDLGV